MALTNEDLKAITELLKVELQPINERLDNLELQVKHTERTLKNEIRNS